MKFVQKEVFTNDSLTRGVVDVLGARGVRAVKKAFESSRDKDTLTVVFRRALDHKFIDLDTFEGYTNTNSISFMPFQKAMTHLATFSVDCVLPIQTKYRKFHMLLESLNFVEADAFYRLVAKKFDVASVESVVYPERGQQKTPRKSRQNPEVAGDSVNETDN